ncbi:MAG TPA: tRNA epoxyqueuosine(34) reductase QueG [Acidobacteriaceae bacterium]|nr:tRNA epoxyqueuosine(34) reductase QueG [Acidobacteriaceae bacterium]
MSTTLKYEQVAALARDVGFSKAGIAPIPLGTESADYPELDHFQPWIEQGYAGEMEYLKRRDQENRLLRSSLQIAAPWARSVIVCAANYNANAPRSTDPASPQSGWIARYAWTGHAQTDSRSEHSHSSSPGPDPGQPTDYHDILLQRLKNLDQLLQQAVGPFASRCYVDTGPLVERVYAKYAGIGWIGKNTCVIDQELGSWLFLGVILTALEVPPAHVTPPPDRCGTCTRCIDACPTGALVQPNQMDASLCISYLTIEKRGPVPEPLRSLMGRQVFGCDICQDVCPWNRRAPATLDPELSVRSELVNPALAWLAEMDAESFRRWFRQSPIQRAKLSGLLRNVAIAMGNSGLASYLPKLREWSIGPDPVLAEAAQWALARCRAQ